jgi:hypothetical protein
MNTFSKPTKPKTHTMIRAKFYCERAEKPYEGTEVVSFQAVTDGSEENKSFAQFTPSANAILSIDNPAAQGKFVQGEEYYVDFTPAKPQPAAEVPAYVRQTKQWRKDIDEVLSALRSGDPTWRDQALAIHDEMTRLEVPATRNERHIAFNRLLHAIQVNGLQNQVTSLVEAVMWLGMDLKAYNEANPGASPNPYPESKNPASARIEPTADGLKLAAKSGYAEAAEPPTTPPPPVDNDHVAAGATPFGTESKASDPV